MLVIMRKKILLSLIVLVSFYLGGQTVAWSKLFDLDSQNASRGLSTNSLLDSNGNIISPVIEI